jgi:hypothetical protein
MPAAWAADLPAILRREPMQQSGVLKTLFRVGAAAETPAPPDLFVFSFPFYAMSDPRLGGEVCGLLNRNYELVEPKGAAVRFEQWEGAPANPAAHRLIDKQMKLIAGYGAAYANPVKRAALLPGARRLGEYWWNARTFEAGLLPGDRSVGGQQNAETDVAATRFKLGPGREITRGGTAELTRDQFNIMRRFDEGTVNAVGVKCFMHAGDGAVWPDTWRRSERQRDAIEKALQRLNTRLLDEGVMLEVKLKEEDLILTLLPVTS